MSKVPAFSVKKDDWKRWSFKIMGHVEMPLRTCTQLRRDKDKSDEVFHDENNEYPLIQTFLERVGLHVGSEFGVLDCEFGV